MDDDGDDDHDDGDDGTNYKIVCFTKQPRSELVKILLDFHSESWLILGHLSSMLAPFCHALTDLGTIFAPYWPIMAHLGSIVPK